MDPRLFIVRVGRVRMAFPLDVVERVLPACELMPLPDSPAAVAGAFNLHGQPVAVVDVRPRLGLAPRAPGVDDVLVLVKLQARHLAVLADEAVGVADETPDAVVEGAALADGAPRPPHGPERMPDRPYPPVEVELAIQRQELVNHYQPKVDIRTGRVTGLEALVRWRHPEDGLVMPNRFVPVAEKYGLIGGLTSAVLRAALADMARWADACLRLNVAVNVSMTNLNDVAFPDELARLAADFDVPLSSLSLEVTEGQLMTEPRSQLDVLTRLRLKRVRLSIDDFGMGYSCMAQLRDLPFDELKVDRSFVDGASRDPSLKAILDASLGLARQLGMSSVGEGVETEADWHCLREAGCDLAQGYLVARPMPADAVAAWSADWAVRFASLATAPA